MSEALERCAWCGEDELYVEYHDKEWGVPVDDATELFERLALEGMQAGLSWITVLRKRQRMREVFFEFDRKKLVRYGPGKMARWLDDPGIIRHRGKLEAMVTNAELSLKEESFSDFLWSFAPETSQAYSSMQDVPAHTPESHAMSKALKKKGYRFVGPTICYAFMQSVGMVNDHITRCFRHTSCAELRADAMLIKSPKN